MPDNIAREHFAPNLFKPPQSARREDDFWGKDVFPSFPWNTYDATFEDLLSKISLKSFNELVKKRKMEGKFCNVLDLMGGGYFIEPNDYKFVDSVTGFRLSDPESAYVRQVEEEIDHEKIRDPRYVRPEYTKRLLQDLDKLRLLQKEPKRKITHGSIFNKRDWVELDSLMSSQNIAAFDVVVCRPEGPFFAENITAGKPLTDYEKLNYGAVFDKVFYEIHVRMNHKDGIIFTQVPQIFGKDWIDKWVEKNGKKYGLKTDVVQCVRDEHYKKETYVLMARYLNK